MRHLGRGKFSRDVALYREVMERIREADIDIIVNLTAGMGGFHRRSGDLLGSDRHVGAAAGRVASTGECAGDDDVVVHGAGSLQA